MHLTRRRAAALIPAALLMPRAAAWAAPAVPPGNRLAFSVWRQGSRIGAHTVDFAPSGDALHVHTKAHFSVGLGPIKLYTYTYDVTETWTGGALTSLTAQTNDNGTQGTCEAHRQGNQMAVTGSKSGAYITPPGSIAGTHWNKAELAAPMINPENGVLMTFVVTNPGSSPPPGGGAAAHHAALTGFATLDLWYDDAGTWVGLRATAKDKSVVEYHPA